MDDSMTNVFMSSQKIVLYRNYPVYYYIYLYHIRTFFLLLYLNFGKYTYYKHRLSNYLTISYPKPSSVFAIHLKIHFKRKHLIAIAAVFTFVALVAACPEVAQVAATTLHFVFV